MDSVPDKSLGQHWLYDETILGAMAEGVEASAGDVIVEIGPGLGTLTETLLKRGAIVIAVEYDRQLAEGLQVRLNNLGVDTANLTVVQGDIREFDFASMTTEYKVCANIPYYLTSNLIRKLTDTVHKPIRASLLVQKEVAVRIAQPNKKASLLTCVAQLWYECSLGLIAPAHLFTPSPRVDSQILHLCARDRQLISGEPRLLYRLFKAGFSEKRKNLRNALSAGLGISKDTAVSLLESAKIEPTRRAETLGMQEWERLYRVWSVS